MLLTAWYINTTALTQMSDSCRRMLLSEVSRCLEQTPGKYSRCPLWMARPDWWGHAEGAQHIRDSLPVIPSWTWKEFHLWCVSGIKTGLKTHMMEQEHGWQRDDGKFHTSCAKITKPVFLWLPKTRSTITIYKYDHAKIIWWGPFVLFSSNCGDTATLW